MSPDKNFWHKRKVLVTGNTGFKGAWLSLWLNRWGADVSGYSLTPPTTPSMFDLCALGKLAPTQTADVRDLPALAACFNRNEPEIIFHMAAQPLVLESYRVPVDTYQTNIMGTVNVLEAARGCKSAKAVVIVTSDKCYRNTGSKNGYAETDALGGLDPYSSSKACAEIVAEAYRHSFFNGGCAVASVRAGNVIGGGDWAQDRLVPDCVRALLKGEQIILRNPRSVRPWQHVFDPLSGYIMLAQLLCEQGRKYAQAWNFGPDSKDSKTVEQLAAGLCAKWGKTAGYKTDAGKTPHEAAVLALDSCKAKREIGWQPKWNFETAVDKTADWFKQYESGADMAAFSVSQLEDYWA